MSGGERETEVKELAVMPWGVPEGSMVVRIAMPVAQREQARRNRSEVSWLDKR